ncbi:MAG: ABC transporter permease subunit [Treponema sp.]|jgi:putative aldouronate transport system permease protein|nr:ABC transporter permease subunit [Treponema sp.]
MAKANVSISHVPLKTMLARDFALNKWKYLLILPVLVYFALFVYKPMYGLIIAFKDYRPNLGFDRSRWVGLKHFIDFFNDVYFFRLLRNTLSISLLSILFGFPAPILLALLLNEIQNTSFKKTVQTITYMPYFISMVVVASLIRTYSASNGIFAQIAIMLGGEGKNYLMHNQYFYPIYVISDIWQGIGWNSIIYLAALTGIDQEQYEAARIDGAGRIRRIFSVTLPNLLPTIMVLFILRMGGILNVGFEKIILLYNEGIYEVADVISTYVYRRGIIQAAFSYASAVGLFNSLVNVAFLVAANTLSKKFTESSLF